MTEKENAIIINGVKYVLDKPENEPEDGICNHCHLYEQCSNLERYGLLCIALFCEDADGKLFVKQQ